MSDVAAVSERPANTENKAVEREAISETNTQTQWDRLVNQPWKIWLVSFIAFLLMGTAWAFASPYDGTPDETEHVIRAAGVAQGQILQKPEKVAGGTGARQRVGQGLVVHNNRCYHGDVTKTPKCAPPPGSGGDKVVNAATGAGRYNPIYYAAVGGPLALWPNWTGLILARLISAALCAAFLASALVSCVQWWRTPILLGGLLIAVTPLMIHLTGGVNPNAVEIAASISLFAAIIPLMLSRDNAATGAWIRRAAIAALLIAQLRSMGPEIVVGALLVMLVPPVRHRIRELWARKDVRWWGLSVAISIVLGLVWTQIARATDIGHYGGVIHYTLRQALSWELTNRLPWYLNSTADGFSYFDTSPPYIGMVWTMAFGVLFLVALTVGKPVHRWRLLALSLGLAAIPTIVDVATVNTFGFPFQARYILPLAVGLPLLSAFFIGISQKIDSAIQASLVRILLLALLPLQWLSLIHVMVRWQHGLALGRSVNPFTGEWLPPAGPVLPIAAMGLAVLTLGALVWKSAGANPLRQSAALPPMTEENVAQA